MIELRAPFQSLF